MKPETPQQHGLRSVRASGYKTVDLSPTMKRKRGGSVPGDCADDRPDRRARGGSVHHKGPTINIHMGDAAGKREAAAKGLQVGAALGAHMGGAGGPPPMAGAPPGMGGPPPMGPRPPMAAPPMPPPGAGPMARGGVMRRANGGNAGSYDDDLNARRTAEQAKASTHVQPANEVENPLLESRRTLSRYDPADDRKRGGTIRVREHERRRVGGAV